MVGLRRSASSNKTLLDWVASTTARFNEVVDLPSPGPQLVREMMRVSLLSSSALSSSLRFLGMRVMAVRSRR